ncbi:MAG: FGGY family carbohydrate kinase, partial [Planctomycetota bacterium]|nr:FGGY family carbohydrate kinase [Planctomycetota bacterium]
MPRTDAYLGVDLGTSSVKVLLVAGDGRVLSTGSQRIPLIADAPLQAEQDAETWWQATATAIQVCLAGAPGARVRSVGLTGQKHALLVLDEHDRPLGPAVLWADGRAQSEAEEVRTVFPAAARRTGFLPQPGFLVPKWLRYLREDRKRAARVHRL